jgi:hypothetical protein
VVPTTTFVPSDDRNDLNVHLLARQTSKAPKLLLGAPLFAFAPKNREDWDIEVVAAVRAMRIVGKKRVAQRRRVKRVGCSSLGRDAAAGCV